MEECGIYSNSCGKFWTQRLFLYTCLLFAFLQYCYVVVVTDCAFSGVILWLLLCIIFLLICGKIFSKQTVFWLLFAYAFYTFCGTLQAYNYFKSFSHCFAPFADDSLFYHGAEIAYEIGISQNAFFNIPYSIFLSFFMPLKDMVACGKEANPLFLLPLSWFTGALCIGFALDLSSDFSVYLRLHGKHQYRHSHIIQKIEERPQPLRYSFLAVVAILLNPIFFDTIIHLYRDGLMILFFMLGLKFFLRHKTLLSLICIAFCSLLRLANGYLLLGLLLSLFLANLMKISYLRLYMLIVLLTGVILIAIFLFFNTSIRLNFAHPEFDSFAEFGEYRYSHYDRNPASMPYHTLAGLFTPMKFSPWYAYHEANITYMATNSEGDLHTSFKKTYINADKEFLKIYNILGTIMLFLWIFIIPVVMLFLWHSIFISKNISLQIVGLFILFSSLLIVAFSMQDRHKCFYMILFPMMIIFQQQYMRNRSVEKVLRFGVAFIILLANIIVLFSGNYVSEIGFK